MSKPTHIHVTAPEGRLCPIARADATGPGGTLLVIAPGEVHFVPYSSYVRRRIDRGDLLVVDEPKDPAPAMAPKTTDRKKEG